ncbi:probable methyltransferase-like protein 25 isoform X1 [Dendrobates tinctorius]|uniref:probable methyltransferase-like protein 25 isoform X1 n=1 Tax=Dendrobates tinctorius TaxID=92724 RepID=UPI003CC995C4
MFARWPAPSTDKVTESMESLLQLLQMSAHISGAHTVEFYTEDIWKNNVGVSPESVLSIFSQQRRSPYQFTAAPDMTSIFSPATNQLVNLESFVEAARYNSLMNLGLCTTIDEILETFASQRTDKRGKGIKSDQFMNDKKSHEVVIMSQLVEALAKLCGVKQVIDLGAGKGYLSSYLSMRYDLKVYGIDSSHTNTDGANERNRKLKKYWQVYKTDARTTSKAQKSNQKKGLLPKSSCQDVNANKDISIQSGSEIRLSNSEPCIDNELRLISDSSKWASNKESNQAMGNPETDNSLDSAFSFLDILPAGAVEVPSVSQSVSKVLSEQEKEHRKMENIKAKKLPESHVYSPLTSYVTADTELHDIVTDLEESIMVGLHTCGDLAPNTLRIFTSKPEMKAVCSVGCCYHFLSEQFEHLEEDPTEGLWGFPMSQYLKERCWHIGRNARMSACLALERVAVGQGLPTESLFYRAVLQVICKEVYGITQRSYSLVPQSRNILQIDQRVGKIFSKSSSFTDYVRKSLKKFGQDDSKLVTMPRQRRALQLLSDQEIMGYYQKYELRRNELEAFNRLKVFLAPCVEALILLDRLSYLREQENLAWSGLVKLFDPVKSPRCYAVVSLKQP